MTTVLVVGGGTIARRVHLPYFAAHPRVDRLLVSDVDPAAAHAAAATPGARVHLGPLATAAAGVAITTTSAATHARLATDAIHAGAQLWWWRNRWPSIPHTPWR